MIAIVVLVAGPLLLAVIVDVVLRFLRVRSLAAYVACGAIGGFASIAALSIVAPPVEVVTGEEDIPFATATFIGAFVCTVYWVLIRRRAS